TGGRHPVVEASLKQQGKIFAPNDCDLTDKSSGRIVVVTGPNMAGKSTFLRQNAIIASAAGAFYREFRPALASLASLLYSIWPHAAAPPEVARRTRISFPSECGHKPWPAFDFRSSPLLCAAIALKLREGRA
ncbi:MAG: MutS-related protein, partial [Methylocystis sp.]